MKVAYNDMILKNENELLKIQKEALEKENDRLKFLVEYLKVCVNWSDNEMKRLKKHILWLQNR